jgi:hypothetical protein
MSDTIQSAEALAFDIAAFDPGSYSVKEMIIPLINSRDAAIRADEARKQAERYAAINEVFSLQRKYFGNATDTHIELSNWAMKYRELDTLVHLADLEAPK